MQRLVDHGTSRWKNGVELEIFMNVDANQQQIDAVQAELDGLVADDQVRDFRFLSKQDAYEEFKRIFKRPARAGREHDRRRAADLVPGRARPRPS